MDLGLSKFKYGFIYLSILFILIVYIISFSGIIYKPLDEITAKIVNRNYNGEGLIELMEAVLWFSAFIIYLALLIKNIKSNKWEWLSTWLIFFTVFCFVAFGEEISWGQHILGFEPSEFVKNINKQQETNIHNLNIIKILGLKSENVLEYYLLNFTSILNPIFYLLCSLLWAVIPLLKWKGKFSGFKLIATLPIPNKATTIFCGINIIAYLVIDKLFFDVGEIFELSLSLVAIMSALDIWFRGSAEFQQYA